MQPRADIAQASSSSLLGCCNHHPSAAVGFAGLGEGGKGRGNLHQLNGYSAILAAHAELHIRARE